VKKYLDYLSVGDDLHQDIDTFSAFIHVHCKLDKNGETETVDNNEAPI